MSHSLHANQLALLGSQAQIPALARLMVAGAVVVTTWDSRRTTRRQLAKLPRHLLNDIGLDALSAARETAKPFWQD